MGIVRDSMTPYTPQHLNKELNEKSLRVRDHLSTGKKFSFSEWDAISYSGRLSGTDLSVAERNQIWAGHAPLISWARRLDSVLCSNGVDIAKSSINTALHNNGANVDTLFERRCRKEKWNRKL
ncbi:hypothetical protein EVAR_9613_1 [Eumeta japonica]|uniref:Uncharacterized protein n=1 Tax=Eumeta variegata TaxID=151549 RepID=A0A4C1TMQ5_EUMVA|nr:hypothetical protein EVAR_9613_1 [Eumeta japonica]